MGLSFVACVYSLVSRYLASPHFWWDESGQFWVSMGLNHFSSLGEPVGSWGKMWEMNRSGYNLDPGGFTAILRVWITLFGSSPWLLRLLPFVFFLLTSLFSGLIARDLCRSRPLWGLSFFLPFFFPEFLYYSLELRAYSMEVAGILLAVFFLHRANQRGRRADLYLLSASLFVFCFSRYAFTVMLVSVSCLWFLNSIAKRRFSESWVVPGAGVLSLAVAYFTSLRYQSPGAEPPDYVLQHLLFRKDLGGVSDILKANFFSFPGLFQSAFVCLYLYCSLRRFKRLDQGVRESSRDFALLLIFYHSISAGLSLAGKLPWDARGRWSIGLQAISLLALIHCMVILNSLVEKGRKRLIYLSSLVVPVLALSGVVHFKRYFSNYSSVAIGELVREGELVRPVFFNKSGSPTARYLLEYGPYRRLRGLREKVVIETDAQEKAKAPIKFGDGEPFSMILSEIAPNRVDEYVARLGGRKYSISYSGGTTVMVDVSAEGR